MISTRAEAGGWRSSASQQRAIDASRLFRGIAPEQLAGIGGLLEERRYEAGEYLLREGETDDFVYVLIEGLVHLEKDTSFGAGPARIGELKPGHTIGELKIADRRPSTASVVAATDVMVIAINLDIFHQHEALGDARAIVWRNVGHILADRLRETSTTGADAVRRELAESEARVFAGLVLLLTAGWLAIYQLLVATMAALPSSYRPPDPVLTFALAGWSAMPVIIGFRRSPYPLASFGLTWKDGWSKAREALLWTIPVLVAALLAKVFAMYVIPGMETRPLFDPAAVFGGRPHDWRFFAVAVVLYCVHAPIQEFVARVGIQGSTQVLLRVPPGRVDWRAIVMANLVFASAHCFLGIGFALAAFAVGLFWGWLFARQVSLIGVTVSHVVIGVWTLFALGLHAAVGGG